MTGAKQFGPYELVRGLGSGGMAETWLALRRGPGGFEQHVCVKRILPFYEHDPEFVRQFLEEARLAAQLRHGNIAQVVDFGEVDGSHYLALELVDGMDLRALLARLGERGQRLDPTFAALIALELAKALDFAHTPGRARHAVVHRDISPSNVLVSRVGEVYLTDFGIARALGVKRRTESGVVRGKVPYMAAEYAMEGRFDGRTDLFGVGVVLFEALSGRRPYDGITDLDTLQRIRAGVHEPLGALVPEAPEVLVRVVEALIRPEPKERPGSAAQLLEALASITPAPTSARRLGDLVCSLSDSLSDSLVVSAPERTVAITAAAQASYPPSYPEVQPASPTSETRTSDVSSLGATIPSRPSQVGPWSSTNPSRISHHGRPSGANSDPVIPVTNPGRKVPATAVDPRPAPHHPALAVEISSGAAVAATPARPRRGLYLALVLLALFAFAIATAGTYALVLAWEHGVF